MRSVLGAPPWATCGCPNPFLTDLCLQRVPATESIVVLMVEEARAR